MARKASMEEAQPEDKAHYSTAMLRRIYEAKAPGHEVALELLSKPSVDHRIPKAILGEAQVRAIEAGITAISK